MFQAVNQDVNRCVNDLLELAHNMEKTPSPLYPPIPSLVYPAFPPAPPLNETFYTTVMPPPFPTIFNAGHEAQPAHMTEKLNPRLLCDVKEDFESLKRLGDLDTLFPTNWVPPTNLLDALKEAEIINAENVVAACYDRADVSCSKYPGITREDAAVIACYTFDFGPAAYEFVNLHFCLSFQPKQNPFRVLNSALFERNVLKLRKLRGLLVLLLSALRRQPRFKADDMLLYRGIKKCACFIPTIF